MNAMTSQGCFPTGDGRVPPDPAVASQEEAADEEGEGHGDEGAQGARGSHQTTRAQRVVGSGAGRGEREGGDWWKEGGTG